MTEEQRQTLAVACPVHPENARIRRVSVVYEEMSPRLLGPGPVLRAATRLAWAGTACGVLGMVAIWIGNLIGGGAVRPALIVGIVCVAYALALYGWAAARRARLTVVERGMPDALAVWRAAWYCDLCDGVFFQPGALRQEPVARVVEGSVNDGDVISPAAFHRLVWKAGRYGGPSGRMAG
ncbi:MAG TPA: hypothetical protein VHZ03_35675 [Trebonia sp.]|jgi:hypothetical protein|nr:hypothetical protein [Trebonia sp.]